jgi:iron(III) transport system permease protein
VLNVLSVRAAVLGAAVAVFVITSVMPLVYMLVVATGDVPSGVLWLDARQRTLLSNSALLAVGTAVLSTMLGAPLGFGLARTPMAHRAVVRILLAAPLLLPPYTVALAWAYLGLFPTWTYSVWSAVVVLSLVYYPVVMLATEVALRQMDPHVEEAGLIVTTPARVLMRITMPLVAPAICGGALIVFVLAISEFGVPALLRVRVYPTEVFTAFAALFDFGRATALSWPLLVLACGSSACAAWLLGSRVVSGRRHTSSAAAIAPHAWRKPIVAVGVLAFSLAIAVPLVVLVRESDDVFGAARGSWPSIRVSLLLAALGATLVVPVGGILGYARARATSRFASAVDALWVVLFAVPSTIVGVALIGMWNRSGPAGMLYGTLAMLLLVYLARFVPVAALITAASVRQIPQSHEESAAVAGVGWLRTLRTIIMPQIAGGLAATWVIVFVFAFGELGASILVSPPGESTLPIRIYTIIANTPSSVVSALALLQISVVLVPLAAGAMFAARRARG